MARIPNPASTRSRWFPLAALALACGGGGGEAEPSGDDGASTEPAITTTAGETTSAETTVAEATSAANREAVPTTSLPPVTVYKSPTCGCCVAWVEHMRAAGFEVVSHDVDDLSAVKDEHGVRPEHRSCHTAHVGGYVIEGHVPAELVRRVLAERPDIAGLAVPGMPRGSPGMEMPDGSRDAYEVIAFRDGGESEVFDRR